ncbi:IclR family transcriptional regulator [Sulfobacillus thermosulfidooxidans]|uniref:IclR family transcriptional regulator n=1 Tax=Sulfobacillus thermosulfidooxidans TaxID=28034 RepID=UPI0002D708BB|nr:IclR family transcriptional regulator [Sulfobacillus thermosulfidooxidans]
MAESWTIKSLSRGLQLLDLMAEQPTGVTIKWLSAVSKIPLSTCYHLMNTLVDSGYVQRDRTRQVYTLSYKISYLHNQVQMSHMVPDELRMVAQKVSQELRETSYVAKWESNEVIIQYIAEGDQAIKVRSLYVGYQEHAFVHALGKVILAHISPKDFHAYYIHHPPQRRTLYSRIQWDEIQRERLVTRERGYSLDEEEWEEGICCIGVPLFNYTSCVWGALAVSLPRHRYDRLNQSTISYLQQEAQMVSKKLGYQNIYRSINQQ